MAARGDIVVALGGNAISRFGDDGTVAAQYRRASEAMRAVADLVQDGWRVVLTHGNGPVVGAIVLRGELAEQSVPPTPLFIAGADSEGGIGLMLQQVLGNELSSRGLTTCVATVVTQVVVDEGDPAFGSPTKPIGAYRTADDAARLSTEYGWTMAEESSRGWRRVVPSPRPRRIVEADAVAALRDAGVLAIAAGGGGVPVTERADGSLAGIDAVIDKDWTAALLAQTLGTPWLAIAMEQDAVYEGFDTPSSRRIERLTASEAASLAERLPSGNVGPKVAAAAWFARHGGTATICRADDLRAALDGAAGTRISGE